MTTYNPMHHIVTMRLVTLCDSVRPCAFPAALIEALRSPDAATVERASRQADLITRGRIAEGALDENIESVVAAENRGCVNPRPSADPATAQQGTGISRTISQVIF